MVWWFSDNIVTEYIDLTWRDLSQDATFRSFLAGIKAGSSQVGYPFHCPFLEGFFYFFS